jgi:hypothetical protein
VAEVDIIETITRKMELNMHLRLDDPAGRYLIRAVLYYQQLPTAEETGQGTVSGMTERLVIDEAEKTFEVPVKG